ncbi:TIGR00297 family protein [Archaeoglobus veneficus]|uniref:TIGR00297 family protein n=1 Tax=Archaeoglobus veneficus (strain DSM 11195 / SNP6) TaxID=693661 RepID=F2KT09_ARCVS|nr:TIGR00297 family protein [Archaeoglobus veneficus]AEA47039.1 protein of unknown function DUF92 transmembrane [Archaeoglobus veneficus SNP6]
MFLLILLSLLIPILPERVVVGLALAVLLAYAIVRDIKPGISRVDETTSYFNSILLSTLMLSTTLLGVPKNVVGAAMILAELHGLREKIFRGAIKDIALFTACGLVYFLYFHYVTKTPFNMDYLFFLSLTGSLAASLVESVETDSDKRTTLLLASATTYLIFNIYALQTTLPDLAKAFAISFALSLAATRAGVADESGLLSATLIGTLVIVFTDIRYFLVLLTFYMLGSASTKYRYTLKLQRGIAEPAGGARGYANVFSNSLAPLFFAINYGFYGFDAFSIAFVASVATALGDTMASEVGKTAERVYLITNFRRVQPGVSGGVSVKGEMAAFAGCAIVSAIALASGIVGLKGATIALFAGFVGVHVDSILGATLEEKGLLTNAGVNFFATLSAGLLCLL